MPDESQANANTKLPGWYPDWARELADRYFSGTTCVFVLHGNVHDLIRMPDANGDGERYGHLVDFLGTNLFGSWDVVLRHDLSHGLRAVSGGDSSRLQSMMQTIASYFGQPAQWPKTPDDILSGLDALIERNLLESNASNRKSVGLLFEFAQYLMPAGDVSSLAGRQGARLVRFLQWAQNPYIKRTNVSFCLVSDRLSDLNERLVQSPHVATIEIPMPDKATRESYIRWRTGDDDLTELTDFTTEQLASQANGLTLTNVDIVLSQAKRSSQRVDGKRFRRLKKSAIERQCQGLLEFIEPSHTLDLVVGHEAAKKRLKEDAGFLADGRLDAAPMGYLVCGPVGTGKTFMAECYAGSIGIPCVMLKNFRSKYVGETEGNLERVLSVLRSLGPVLVIIDEADAALGNRTSSGDSGTSSRVFSMIATQMGNTRYRGKILWMLLTSRPDLLPIDLKRQGRAEVHIPLFYPDDADELKEMFRVMARKNDIDMQASAIPKISVDGSLSGADIEGILLAAKRNTLSAGETEVDAPRLADAFESFIPSSQGLEKEMQEIAAVLECTHRAFLPQRWREVIARPNGRSELQNRLVSLRAIIDE
jgi:AAA+ superfamily predicted ATPase